MYPVTFDTTSCDYDTGFRKYWTSIRAVDRKLSRGTPKLSVFGGSVAIRWLFFHDAEGQCRWEVRGAEGPIATSGMIFMSVEDCIADARSRGFSGTASPTVVIDPAGTAPDARAPKRATR